MSTDSNGSPTNSPCRQCGKASSDGLQCDKCNAWQCDKCFNSTTVLLTRQLYRALTDKGEFPWMCGNCSQHGLYFQLLASGAFQWDELIKLGCNPTAVDQSKREVEQRDADRQRSGFGALGSHSNGTDGAQQVSSGSTNGNVGQNDDMLRMFMAMQKQQNEIMQQMMQSQQRVQQAMLDSQQQLANMIRSLNVSSTSSQQANSHGNWAHSGDVQMVSDGATSMSTAATLPRLQLPQFDGDFLKWNNFWESFEINVHQQRLHDKQKLDYLHQLLKGPAYDKIKGLGMEGDNYREAVKILKQHYGDPCMQRKAQWDAFHSLPMVKDNLSNLEKFNDEARAIVTALKRHGTTDAAINVMVPELLKKLPLSLVSKYNEARLWDNRSDDDEVEDVNTLLRFLRQFHKVHMLSISQAKQQSERQAVTGNTVRQNMPQQRIMPTSNFNQQVQQIKANRKCVFCEADGHYSDDCKKVVSVDDRKQRLIKDGRCFKCLASGHSARQCQRTKKCFTCKQQGHHTAICHKSKPTPARSSQLCSDVEPVGDACEDAEIVNAQMNLAAGGNDGIVMAAFPCNVMNPKTKKTEQLFVYVDGGARFTCFSQAAADKLNLKPRKEVSLEVSRFNANDVDVIRANVVHAKLLGNNGFTLSIDAYAVAKTAPAFKVNPVHLNKEGMDKLRQLKPLNCPPRSEVFQPVDILIGLDYWNAIMGPDFPATKVQNHLYVHHTPLGNVLCGNANSNGRSNVMETTCMLCPSVVCDPMEQLWQLEAIGINSPDDGMFSTKHQRMLDDFDSKITKKDGRYEVGLPWKAPNPQLASNYHVAKARLESSLRTLAPNGKATAMFKEYNDVIQDQLAKGIVESVAVNHQDGPVKHYVSHFPVIKQGNATTKVRIVYDASAKTKTDKKSLNDMVYIGPCLLNDLTGILLRFRTYTIAMVADIEKAFLQVGLRKEDRDAVRFLWLKDPTNLTTRDNLQVLRFTRVPFGVGSSPFLLGATVKNHLEQQQSEVADLIKRNIYVDNVIMGADQPSTAISHYKESKDIFNGAAMNLRQWMSNDPTFNCAVQAQDKSAAEIINVLGMQWDTKRDVITVNGPSGKGSDPITKRTVLQQLGQCFDPLGLISPVLIKAKVFTQKLWKAELKWDDALSYQLTEEWNQRQLELNGVSTIKVRRSCVISRQHPVTLCCFSDASESAYAAAVYIRQSIDGQVATELVFSKSRVAPIKPAMTIPQLELTAALIGSRALKFVINQCDLVISDVFLWSDSQIVLHWLHSSKDLPAYVDRRKNEILKTVTKFGYVNTKENPADYGTRGCNAQQLVKSNWFHGPGWLCKEPSGWPRWNSDNAIAPPGAYGPLLDHGRSPSTSPSGNHVLAADQTVRIDASEGMVFNCERRSTLRSMLRVVAFCKRFIDRLKKKTVSTSRTVNTEEMKQAWLCLIKDHQQHELADVKKHLESKQKNQLIKQLDLLIKDGIIRCGGRLGNAFPEETALPILLSRNSQFTKLVINDAHEKVLHYGVKSTLAQLRKTIWIPHGYTQVRKVLRECKVCRRHQGGTFKPPRMAQLPKERVQRCPAFRHTGLDYMGPMMIRNDPKGEHEKRWIAIFTCFATRAVHLEVVNDCSTEAATQAILRFIGRRGTPHTILTDNATQFKKANNVLTTMWNNQANGESVDEMVKFFADRNIEWKFIPEGSPWVGGFYERLVGVVKRALKKLLWKATITNEMLSTLVTQLEGIINTRPLLQPSHDQREYNVLTPAHFVAPCSQLVAPPSEDDDGDPEFLPTRHPRRNLLKQWHQIEKKLNQFWDIWQNQYLHELREVHQAQFKPKQGEVDRTPSLGEVCLLKDATPRATWKLVRIMELLPGPDKEVRFAMIKFPTGHVTRRAIKDLVPLEAHLPAEPADDEIPIDVPAADCRGTTN